MFRGLVQAGATAAIKCGELCVFNETSGYWVPINAVADGGIYRLAMAAEEVKASDPYGIADQSRYIDMYALAPEDVFEFELAAAAGAAIGDLYTLTATTTQVLTATTNGFNAVAKVVGFGHYPTQTDTTIRSVSHAQFSFLPYCTEFGHMLSEIARPRRMVISTAASLTLLAEQCFGSLILTTAAATITLPAVQLGMDITVQTSAHAVSVDPNGSDRIILDGTALDDGDKVTNASGAGDTIQLVAESASGWTNLHRVGTWTDGS